MSSQSPRPIVYKLAGNLKEAAKTLIALEKNIIENRPDRYSTGARANMMRRDVMHEVRNKAPELVKLLGLDQGAVQVEQQDKAHPRAYNHYPHLTTSKIGEETHFFILCPVDYKGAHKAPAGATKVPAKDLSETEVGNNLQYKKKGYFSPALLKSLKTGAALPADFTPVPESASGRKYKVFIAGGSSLACVNDYIKRRDALEQAKEDISRELSALAPKLIDSVLGADQGDRLRAQCFFRTGDNGKTEIWLQLSNEDRDRESVVIRDNEYFSADDYKGGAFRIKPNRETEAGRKLGRLFDRVLSAPDLGQYWQIHNPTASGLKEEFARHAALGNRVPKLDTVRGVHYLIYLLDDDAAKDHCNPPGSIPVNLAEYLWLKADIDDERNFIRPAEPPPALSHMRPIKPAAPKP